MSLLLFNSVFPLSAYILVLMRKRNSRRFFWWGKKVYCGHDPMSHLTTAGTHRLKAFCLFVCLCFQTAYTIPILAFAFVCHPEVLPIYTELREWVNTPTGTALLTLKR